MFDLKVEQPINPPELSPEEQAAVDKFAELKDARIEEVVVDRMLDPEYVIGAALTCLGDNIDTQTRMANLLMGHGDKSIHIANLKLDCMDELRRQARKEAEGRIGRSGQDSKGRGCTDTVQEMVTPNV